MSTRATREKGKKQNELHRMILTKVLQQEDNRICADCDERMPRWASWSLGIFVCLKCSGSHRSLGKFLETIKIFLTEIPNFPRRTRIKSQIDKPRHMDSRTSQSHHSTRQ